MIFSQFKRENHENKVTMQKNRYTVFILLLSRIKKNSKSRKIATSLFLWNIVIFAI